MPEPIFDPRYWADRLDKATHLHHAVFRCPLDKWERIEGVHRSILARLVGDTDSVLDAGCGYGRLLTLMPPSWCGDYHGVDLSPDLVAQARKNFPARTFVVDDLRGIRYPGKVWDWGVLISIRPMVLRNAGQADWDEIESRLRRHCAKLLYLEYDETDEGEVVT